jgi:hypothetical protein
MPDNLCPSGFSCQAGHCYRPDSALLNRLPDGGDAGDGGGADACVPSQAIADCMSQVGLVCDPVCQSGCCGDQKCTTLNDRSALDSLSGKLGCVPAGTTKQLLDPCLPSNAGTPNRYDDCLPGLICIDGDQKALCFKLCRTSDDCASLGTACKARRIDIALTSTATATVCELPNANCNPTDSTSRPCPANQTCYLVNSDATAGDTTVCEISAGGQTNGACTSNRNCLPGYTCPTQGSGAAVCRLVCSHAPGATPCPGGTTCQPFGKEYSYCSF